MSNLLCLTLSLADTHGSYCCHNTGIEWPNMHEHTYEGINTQKNPQETKIEYTGSIAKVGRQEGGCPMDCRLKTRDGHYHLALGAV